MTTHYETRKLRERNEIILKRAMEIVANGQDLKPWRPVAVVVLRDAGYTWIEVAVAVGYSQYQTARNTYAFNKAAIAQEDREYVERALNAAIEEMSAI